MAATALAIGILLDAARDPGLVVRGDRVDARWNWWLPTWPARELRVEPSLPRRTLERKAEA